MKIKICMLDYNTSICTFNKHTNTCNYIYFKQSVQILELRLKLTFLINPHQMVVQHFI